MCSRVGEDRHARYQRAERAISMKWVYSTFHQQGKKIKPHLCHPFYHKIRMAYLFETYGVIPDRIQKIVDMQIDFGGMICTKDPTVDVELSGERIISCWQHQASNVVRVLENAIPTPYGCYTFYRFSRWPGVLCFISKTDRDTVLKTLRRTIDLESEMDHNARMHEHLVQANARGDKKKEKAVREIMRGPNPNN